MPRIIDFRKKSQFGIEDVCECGLFLGKTTYWKLYTIENFYRIIINSILSAQLNTNWWPLVVNSDIHNRAEGSRRNYIARPWHGVPGKHLIYFTNLYDLNEIARVSSDLFTLTIPEIDQWIFRIEMLRLPRNVVAHMNFPIRSERQRIDVFYNDFKALIEDIKRKARIILKVPN